MNPSSFAVKADMKFSQYGEKMTFVQESEGEPNPATGLPTIDRDLTEFMGMWSSVRLSEIGNLVQVGDAVIWAGGNAIPTPDITDWISVDGKAWQIIAVEGVRPGRVPICWRLIVREAGSSAARLGA